MNKPKYYLTTPIYYANSRPHVGSAYTTIVCDVIARYKRMCGYEVAYLTGTDEHGVNIERAAEKLGVTPQALVDKNQQIFRDLWKLLGITYTDFVRTTAPEHERAVQTLVRRTMERTPDAIYKAKYEGRYCIYDNLYVSDTPEPANCQICGRPAELISEENYFFKLSAYKDRLLDYYVDHPDFVCPDFRLNEVKAFVAGGLKDLSISRKTIKWGIPWPGDSGHVFYVWYDALTSYMSGVGYESSDSLRREYFESCWPADLHMIGKEIIRFHAVYWPAFLMAADLPLPEKIFAHGWLLFEREKMSKSKGNVAYPEPIVNGLGNDALRYYLLRETVFGQDGNFSRSALIASYNSDLANGLGNLSNRILTMICRYFDGVVPAPSQLEPADNVLLMWRMPTVANFSFEFDRFAFSKAIDHVWSLISSVDKYLVETKPWALSEDPSKRNRLASVLWTAAESLRVVTVLVSPVIPDAAAQIGKQMGLEGRLGNEAFPAQVLDEKFVLQPGTRIGIPEAVFPRVDKDEISERIEAMENEIRNPGAAAEPAARANKTDASIEPPATAGAVGVASHQSPVTNHQSQPAAAPANAKITIDDFAKVELRVGVVKTADRIQGADKLLKLTVDIGDEVRQVLAGIALAYAPEDLVGRKVVIVVNLAPRKMRGVESNGMLLAASAGADGKPVLCTFAEDIPAGAKVR